MTNIFDFLQKSLEYKLIVTQEETGESTVFKKELGNSIVSVIHYWGKEFKHSNFLVYIEKEGHMFLQYTGLIETLGELKVVLKTLNLYKYKPITILKDFAPSDIERRNEFECMVSMGSEEVYRESSEEGGVFDYLDGFVTMYQKMDIPIPIEKIYTNNCDALDD